MIRGERELSFGELDRHVDALAQSLPMGARVLGAVTADAELLALLALAVPRAGMAFYPANPHSTAEQIDRQFAQAGTSTVLRAPPPPTQSPLPLAQPTQAVQLIIATSGSTGTPKGAMLSGANIAASVTASRRVVPLEANDVWLGCLPLHAIGGLSVLFRCLHAGCAMLLHDRFNAADVARDLAQGRASHVSLVPAMLAQLLALKFRPSPRLRCALIGGAPLPLALAEQALAAGWPINPTYGMSETGSQCATCTDASDWIAGLAGFPLPGYVIETTPIETTPTRRLRLRGPAVMAGYANPLLTPGDGLDAEGWFLTNDLGYLDSQGRVVVLGRADDVIISGGINIHPAEVEHLAGRCPGVHAIGITGVADPIWGERLVAVAVTDIAESVFLAWCAEHLPAQVRPRALLPVDALPLSVAGKLDRAGLRQIASAL
jgi:O-succinylbenzoic acid--CoA ligase